MFHGVEHGEPADLRLAAHSLKSNSADLGAATLRDLCKDAELMGKQGELGGAEALVSLIRSEYAKLEAVVKSLRGEM